MFAVMMMIDLLFARFCSLSRPASLDLGLFTNPSEMRLLKVHHCLVSVLSSKALFERSFNFIGTI